MTAAIAYIGRSDAPYRASDYNTSPNPAVRLTDDGRRLARVRPRGCLC